MSFCGSITIPLTTIIAFSGIMSLVKFSVAKSVDVVETALLDVVGACVVVGGGVDGVVDSV